MSVTVSIDIPGGDMTITRPTTHLMFDGPTIGMRQAADILEDIATDIRRMYPLEGEPTT